MRSTIINKKKICISCGTLDYHFSKKMCKQCATVKSTSKRVEKYEEEQHDESLLAVKIMQPDGFLKTADLNQNTTIVFYQETLMYIDKS